MPYLPPNPTLETSFPIAYGRDIATAIKMIEEKWARHFPLLDYYPLLKHTTVITDPNVPIGDPGTTKFDPVWGEAVPAAMATWENPHANAVADAPRPELYGTPVKLNIRIQKEAHQLELKRYGFDRVRDLLAFVPLSVLDKAGITVQVDDYFIWDGRPFEVKQIDPVGYWHNTNVRLYMAMNCEHRRPGS